MEKESVTKIKRVFQHQGLIPIMQCKQDTIFIDQALHLVNFKVGLFNVLPFEGFKNRNVLQGKHLGV